MWQLCIQLIPIKIMDISGIYCEMSSPTPYNKTSHKIGLLLHMYAQAYIINWFVITYVMRVLKLISNHANLMQLCLISTE